MAKIIRTTDPVYGIWNLRSGTVIDHLLEESEYGLRICVTTWDDDSSIRINLIEGSGKSPDFCIHCGDTVSEAEVDEMIPKVLRAADVIMARRNQKES